MDFRITRMPRESLGRRSANCTQAVPYRRKQPANQIFGPRQHSPTGRFSPKCAETDGMKGMLHKFMTLNLTTPERECALASYAYNL